jgi:ADP-ribose pyrophosphatase YjhB (NUDIX family)
MLAESIRDELVKVFTVPQAEVLARCVVTAHDALATRSDMHDLSVAMTALAEQQKLTSAEVRDLAEQQKLTSAELRDLSHTVAGLAEQQKLTSAELRDLSYTVADLAEQQKLTSAELRDLSHTVADLAEQQKLTSAEVRELAEQQKLTSVELRDLSHTVADLADTVRTLHIRTDKTAGWALEWVVGNRLPAYVGREIKRCRVVGSMDVIESLEDRPAIRELSDEDLDQLRRADLIASGVIDDEKIYLVGEVSFTADNDDVLRAARRAAVLRKVGERSQPFVACDAIGSISAELARREGVWIIVEGRLLAPAA